MSHGWQDSTLPVVSRTGTGGVGAMQVLVGSWHRRMHNSLTRTACGISYHSQFAPARREALSGTLCDVCFTREERMEAAMNNKKDEP